MLPVLNAEKPGFERDSVSVSPDAQRAALHFPEKPGFLMLSPHSPLPTPYSRSRNSPTVSCKGGGWGGIRLLGEAMNDQPVLTTPLAITALSYAIMAETLSENKYHDVARRNKKSLGN